MADVRPHPHDVMVHAVLSDVAEATGFLRVICPPPLMPCAVQLTSPLGASRSGRPMARCEPAARDEKPVTDEEAAGEQRETEHHGGADPESSPREAPSRVRGL